VIRVAAALAVGLVLVAPAQAAEAAPPKLRLQRLNAPGLSPALVEAIEAALCDALVQSAKGEVMCPADLAAAAALQRQATMFGTCAGDDCVKPVQEAVAADRVVSGLLARDGSGLKLSLTLTGAVAGVEAKAEASLPADLEPLIKKLPALVKQLLR
jgi:hypothetical protein